MRPLIYAGRRPLFLAVLLTASTTGLLIVWWLLPLGCVVYLAAVALAARDPAMRVRLDRAALRRDVTSATFRAALDEIDRAQQEIETCLEGMRRPLAQLLEGARVQTAALVDQAHELARKGAQLERYLAGLARPQLQRQIDQLEAQLAQTTDRFTVEQLQLTLAARRAEQEQIEGLEIYRGRVSAQLQNIAANLRRVYAETIQLAASAPGVAEDGVGVAERLRDLHADMAAFLHVLDTAIADGAT